MSKPEKVLKESIRVSRLDETVLEKSVSRRLKRYGRIPMPLLLDPLVSDQAKVVFGIIAAGVFQGNVANVGQRWLSGLTGLSVTTVCRRIQELVDAHYLEKAERDNGKRAFYVLTSPVFGQKQRAGVEEVISSPSGNRRLASVRKAAS